MGWTPLHIALNTRDLELFKRLLQMSPDTSLWSKDGLTVAASLARRTGSRQVTHFVIHRIDHIGSVNAWHASLTTVQFRSMDDGHTWILEHEGAMIGLFVVSPIFFTSRDRLSIWDTLADINKSLLLCGSLLNLGFLLLLLREQSVPSNAC